MYGNHVESKIPVVIERYKDILNELQFAVISCIDSTHVFSQDDYFMNFISSMTEVSLIRSGIRVKSSIVPRILETNKLFHGFDEIWFFDRMPLTCKPNNITLVSPYEVSVGDIAGDLAAWIGQSAFLGLGDGVGLNYVTSVYEYAAMLDKLEAVPER